MTTTNIVNACPFKKGTCEIKPFAVSEFATTASAKTRLVKDSIKFGMSVTPTGGCCITRFLGGKHTCCDSIKSGKPFEKAYVSSIEKVIQETANMPSLDKRVIEKLNEIKEYDRLKAMAEKIKQTNTFEKSRDEKANQSKESWLKKALLAPFRFIKWIFIGLGKDIKRFGQLLKRLFKGERSDT